MFSSGFSFLTGGEKPAQAKETEEKDAVESKESEQSTGFSFLSTSSTDQDGEKASDAVSSPAGPIASPTSNGQSTTLQASTKSVESSTKSPPPDATSASVKDIKLATKSTSSTKVIKKKKKASNRVGFDRGNEAPLSPPPIPSAIINDDDANDASEREATDDQGESNDGNASTPSTSQKVDRDSGDNNNDATMTEDTAPLKGKSKDNDGPQEDAATEVSSTTMSEKVDNDAGSDEDAEQSNGESDKRTTPVTRAKQTKSSPRQVPMEATEGADIGDNGEVDDANLQEFFPSLLPLQQSNRDLWTTFQDSVFTAFHVAMLDLHADKDQLNSDYTEEANLIIAMDEKLGSLNAEQSTLVEQEDFEGAHALHVQYEKLVVLKRASEDKLLYFQKEHERIDEEVAQLRASLVVSLQKTASALGNLDDKRKIIVDSEGASTLQSITVRKKELDAAKSLINEELETFVKEENEIKTKEDALNEKVEAGISDVIGFYEMAKKDKEEVSKEIEDLEKQLKEKRQAAKELDSTIKGYNVDIDKHRQMFKDEIEEMDGIRSTFTDKKSGVTSKATANLQQDDELKQEEDSFMALQSKLEESIATNTTQVTVFEAMVISFTDLLNINTLKIKHELMPSFRTEFGQVCSDIKESVAKKVELQHELEYVEGERNVLNERLSSLDIEKKKHVAAKRFKEAGEVSKEQQQLLKEVNESSENISGVQTRMEEASKEVEACEDKKRELLSQWNKVERSVDLRTYKKLEAHHDSLMKCKQRCTEGREATDGHVKNTVALIESEVQAVKVQMDTIKSHHQV